MTDRGTDLPLNVPMDTGAGELDSSLSNLVRIRWSIVRLLPGGGIGVVATLLTINLALAALPVVFVIATGILLGRVPSAVQGGVGSPAWDSLVVAFLVAAGAFVALQVITPVRSSVDELLVRRVDRRVYDQLMAASLGTPGVTPLEQPEAQDDLRIAGLKLQFAIHTPGQACAGLLALVARYGQLAGFVAVAGFAVSWLAAAGLLASVLLLRHGIRGGLSRYADARRRIATAERRGYYLSSLGIEPGAGREIRVFGLADWLAGAYRQVYGTWLRANWLKRRQILVWHFAGYAVGGLVLAAIALGTIGGVAAGSLTLTEFALITQAALGALALGGQYHEADLQTAIGTAAHDQIRQFMSRVETAPTAAASHPRRPVPDGLGTIQFDNVSFRYPGQDRSILEGLDLTIPAGRCTAIVGVNGAGKTTLVKLLARLYEPTAGAILVDGIDIRSFAVDEWRTRLAVIFQDFLKYEVSAADNIGFGSVEHLDDRPGIRAAAESAGIADVIDELPRGFDTPLARHMAGGAELSGGQWQRVALARTLFATRCGAQIVVLDEPTASLDIRTEAAFFDQFAELTRSVTTLLISHRFSTVRHADLIAVLADGQVSEQGSHAELMALGGRYATAFRLQADHPAGAAGDIAATTVREVLA
jgi:ATP-binding cassette subfamily B protein